jgi:hypothetical protein
MNESDEMSGEALHRLLRLCENVLSYLVSYQSKDIQPSEELKDQVVETFASSVVVLYAVSVALCGENAIFTSGYFNLIVQGCMLKREVALRIITSLALFLDICPAGSSQDEAMCAVHEGLYFSFPDVSDLNSELRDIVLCTLVNSTLLRVLVVNILLESELSECSSGEGIQYVKEDIPAFELCGVLLAVSKQDLEEIHANPDAFSDNDLSNWGILLCPLKILQWSVLGDNKFSDDESIKALVAFTQKLEVCFQLTYQNVYIDALYILIAGTLC